jgi:hypothetical protein
MTSSDLSNNLNLNLILCPFDKLIGIDKIQNKINKGKNYGNWVLSLTTTPKRIDKVANALCRLYAGNIVPPKIILNLARYYPRWDISFNESDLPNNLNVFKPRLEIVFHDKDEGPGMKIVGTIKHYLAKNEKIPTILTIDDDIAYPHDFIETAFKESRKMPNAIICRKGFKWRDYLTIGATPNNKKLPIDIAEGFGSILYPHRIWGNISDFLKYWDTIVKSESKVIYDDDVVLSIYWEIKKIRCYRVPFEISGKNIKILTMGNQADALHLQKWGGIGDEHKRKRWIYESIYKILIRT